MKKFYKRTISMLVSLSLIAGFTTVPLQNACDKPLFSIKTAHASTLKNGLEYTIEDGNAIIVGCDKSATNIEIPEKIEGYNVTTIADSAFEYCVNLKNVTLPQTLKTISSWAFYDCDSLESIIIPDSVTEIGDSGVDNCDNLKSITLSKNLKSLGYHAFYGAAIKEITIPSSLEWSNAPFAECSSLESVNFAPNTISIAPGLFEECSGLKSITIPDGVTSIGDLAFYNCSNLTNITLPDTLKTIGEHAIQECHSLESITIPASVTEIGVSGVDNCTNLKFITLSEGIKSLGYHAFYGAAIKEITIPSSLEWADAPFAGCDLLESVTFATDTTNIASGLFEECSGLKSITIPDGVTSIGDSAFYNCSNLTNITLPDTLKTIGNHAIQECDNLESIIIPDSVTEIGDSGVDNCDNLKSITLSKNLKSLGYHAFYGAAITEITIPNSLENADEPFANCNNLSYIEFSDNSTKVCNWLFYDCPSLKYVSLPNSIKEIGDYSFANCTQLTTVSGGDKNLTFSPHSFENCPMLHDSRFSLLDPSSYINVNNNISSVNGIVNYTLRYQLNESVAKKSSDYCVSLNIPEGMSIIPESIASNIIDEERTDYTSDTFYTTKPTGIIKFSCRIQEYGDYSLSPVISFDYNDDYWEQTIGSIDVEVPKLTCNALNTVNKYEVEVHGIAEKDASIEIYIDDKKVKMVKSNEYTGKYNALIPLPEKSSGSTYHIYAQNGSNISDEITVTYGADEPVVKSVKLIYNEDQEADITNVFTEGATPIFSIASTYYQFEIETENTDKIYKVLVSSTKGNDTKYLEAVWNEEKQKWITEGYFDSNNESYVPGSLNIVISPYIFTNETEIAKLPDNINTNDISPQIIQNSYQNTLIDNGTDFYEEIVISDGIKSETINHYCVTSDGLIINGKKIPINQIIETPFKYGYNKSSTIVEEDGKKYQYYYRQIFSENIEVTEKVFDLYSGSFNGVSILKIAEGERSDDIDCIIVNDLYSNIADEMLGETFIPESASLLFSMVNNSLTYAKLASLAQNENEFMLASSWYIGRMYCTCALASLGIMATISPVTLLALAIFSDIIFDYSSAMLEEYFKQNGFIKFAIDPSGYVYEAIPSNRVENAEMTIYYLDSESGEAILWNAEDYDQINPLLTDKYGTYAWDVPEGKWKVVCSKEGYETAESEWVNVPPVQTDVNFALISHESPEIISAEYENNQIILSFSKYMIPSTINNSNINISGIENYKITPVYENKNDDYAINYAITADFSQAGTISISSTNNCKSYSDTPATPSSINVTINDNVITTTSYTTTSTSTSTTATTTTTVPPVSTNVPLGDVNEDGNVNATDSSLILAEYSLLSTGGESSLTEKQRKAADINNNGLIDATDASFVLAFYSYLSTGGTESDMRIWLETQ